MDNETKDVKICFNGGLNSVRKIDAPSKVKLKEKNLRDSTIICEESF